MLISLVLAWFTVLFCLLTALKWVARKSGNRGLNRFFHKIHIPFGVLSLVTGLLHGIFAGNPFFCTLSDFTPAPLLFTWNFGTFCYVGIILLAVSYLLRKILRKRWMLIHRILTVVMLILLVFHLINMGISLPGKLFRSESPVTDQTTDITESTGEAPAEVTKVTKENVEETTEKAEKTTEKTTAPVVKFSGAVLNDGTYSGSADGYKGPIELTVVVENGQVTDITILSNYDTPKFFSSALSIVDSILDRQTLQVDAVTGASYSSAGILNAVYDALTPAVAEGEFLINDIDPSAIS